MNTVDQLRKCGIVPVVVINKVEEAVPLAKALLAGGINCAEITFRTEAAADAIAAMAKEVPDMIVGAGTVLTVEQAELAVKNGATFLVSPGIDEDVIKAAERLGVAMLPGAVTPTEMIQGMKLGIKLFKFFPAGNYGGIKTIKSMAAPFTAFEFCPTGGVSLENLADYLSFKKIAFVGGSWMCPANLISEGKWDEIEELTRQAVTRFRELRPAN